MGTMTESDVVPAGLADRLLRHAEGMAMTVAGLTILSQAMDGHLLAKLESVISDDAVRGVAWVDWDMALNITAGWSGGERRVIELAASLAGNGTLIDLADALTGLDAPTSLVVAEALGDCLAKDARSQSQER